MIRHYKEIDFNQVDQRITGRTRKPTTFYTPPDKSIPQLARRDRFCYETPKRYTGPSGIFLPADWTWKSPPEWKNKWKESPFRSSFVYDTREEEKEARIAAQFMHLQFGQGFRNETLYEHSNFYSYFSKYGRGDLRVCETFEKMCFICKQSVKQRQEVTEEDTGLEYGPSLLDPVFCASPNCPKVYHQECLLLADSNSVAEHTSSELYLCPRHACRFCRNMLHLVYCSYCPTAICVDCQTEVEFLPGIGQRYVCNGCAVYINGEFINAPELLMSLRD